MLTETSTKSKILIVDDEESNLRSLFRILRQDYDVITSTSASEAIKVLKNTKDIALIMSDQRMPDMTGSQFLGEAIKISPSSIRFLITGYSDLDAVIDAINTGHIYRYVTKPWSTENLLLDVKRAVEHYLTTKENFKLAKFNEKLVSELKELLFNTVSAISNALETKDSYTYGHSSRVTYYSVEIGRVLNLDHKTLTNLEFAGLLHDIGKIGVPENILNKPGFLTHDEYDIICKHPEQGGNILSRLKSMAEVVEWVKHHHERFDGTGYPDRLQGEEIPLCSRIMAVADAYDAMTSDRPYRQGMPHTLANQELLKCSGTQFDPRIVDIFLKTKSSQTGFMPPVEYSEPLSGNAFPSKNNGNNYS